MRTSAPDLALDVPGSPISHEAILPRTRLGASRLLAWILPLYALAHLSTIASPPIGRDAWRETDVLMVGRNFCVEHTPLWAPRIDQRGNGPGITGMEFPLLNAVEGGLACLGVDQVLAARVIALLFALLGIASLARLAVLFLEPSGATVAVLTFAASPLIYYYGRAVQPDVPALSLALFALVLLESALREPTLPTGRLVGSSVAMGLALLVKLPAIVYGLPAAWLVLRRYPPRAALRDLQLWVYPAVALLPALAWYRHARRLEDTYGIHYFYLGSSWQHLWAAWTSVIFYRRIFLEQLFDVYAFPLAAVLSVAAYLGWRRVPTFVRATALGCLAFLFLAGFQASHHLYYGVLVTPAVALGAGAGFDRWSPRLGRHRTWAMGALCAGILAYAPLRCGHWFPVAGADAPLRAAAQELDRRAPDRRVLVVSRGDPKLLWFLDRKGWIGPSSGEAAWLAQEPLHAPAVALDGDRLSPATMAELEPVLAKQGYTRVLAVPAVHLWVDPAQAATR